MKNILITRSRPTARTLEYAFRRLHGESVRILLSERREAIGEAPLGMNRALPPERVRQMDVEGLSLAAIQYILGNRLGAAACAEKQSQQNANNEWNLVCHSI